MDGISIVSDTNPLIYLLNGNTLAAEYLDGKQVWVSVISELELFGKKGLDNNEIEAINSLLNSCFIAEINPHIKELTKSILQKVTVKIPDAIVAATAVYLDMPLLTADVGFTKIPDLKLILLEF